MAKAEVILTEEMVEELSRRKLADHKKALRSFLRNPIRANQWLSKPEEDQWKALKTATETRLKALFALYDIPDDWPNEVQWTQLAFCLAGEAFAGCRTLHKGLGGPGGEKFAKKNQAKERLFLGFEEYLQKVRHSSEARSADHFVGRNRPGSKEAGYRTLRRDDEGYGAGKSFLQGFRRWRRKKHGN
jgi:hypothetical protein